MTVNTASARPARETSRRPGMPGDTASARPDVQPLRAAAISSPTGLTTPEKYRTDGVTAAASATDATPGSGSRRTDSHEDARKAAPRTAVIARIMYRPFSPGNHRDGSPTNAYRNGCPRCWKVGIDSTSSTATTRGQASMSARARWLPKIGSYGSPRKHTPNRSRSV